MFNSPTEVATEISMLTKVGDLKLKEMSVVGETGTLGVVDGSGKLKSGLLMSTAEGTSVDGMIKNLPTETAERASAMQKLRSAVKQVGHWSGRDAFQDGRWYEAEYGAEGKTRGTSRDQG